MGTAARDLDVGTKALLSTVASPTSAWGGRRGAHSPAGRDPAATAPRPADRLADRPADLPTDRLTGATGRGGGRQGVTCTQVATDGTFAPLSTKSMYQSPGRTFGLSGTLTVTVPSACAVIGNATDRCSVSVTWV
ncbi:hypothetical protein FF36_01796 [Frankia torreyi]|uniref:Uncharacterized protein n=1 Tax=Frankia torreyi TaxID=1856 RepID=A0A0D8BHZ4_9ACTN|nr:hypothetical protein FF36_01796 [Frankia torreyi]KQM05772.1 hypothetical protein FF86_101357 [Frankia sp. CpI1-P]